MALAIGQIQPVWTRNYDTSGHDLAAGCAIDGQGNVCVLIGSSNDFATLKYSPTGTLLWSNRYDFSLEDIPTAIAVNTAGQVWVTGISTTNRWINIVTIKYDADGARLWVRASEETNTITRNVALAVDVTGNSYVAGSSTSSFVAIKYDANGTPIWIRHYEAPAAMVRGVQHAALDGAGNFHVIGSVCCGGGPTRLVLLNYDPSGILVSAAVNYWPTDNDILAGAVTDIDGNAYVSGAVMRPSPWLRHNYFTAKYSPTGSLLWSAYHPPENGYHALPRALNQDATGNVIVTGYEVRPVDEDDDEYSAVTIKYNPEGTELWTARSTFQRLPRMLLTDSQGNIYVGGETDPFLGPYGTFLLKYAPDGSQLWYADFPSIIFGKFALGPSAELYLNDGRFETGWGVETRKFVEPAVAGQPTATIVPALTEAFIGSSVTLTALVSGTGPFSYWWQHFGYNTGATNATLTIPNVQYDWRIAGNYTVIVSNAAGYTISPEARIHVLLSPWVALQSSNQYASVGEQVTFAASANGTEPLSFQWYFNGGPIPGATSNALTVANVRMTNAGEYFVTVTNRAGTATSGVVRLVLVLPLAPFTNAQPIQISSNTTPYPSEIVVQGVSGNILKITALLCGLTSPYPDGLNVLLQSPNGRSVMVMSGVGDCAVSNVNLTFDDEASYFLPSEGISSGTFKPTSYRDDDEPISLPPPAPGPPWGITLSELVDQDPNGIWRLFVAHDYGDRSEIACGWSLKFFAADPGTTFSTRIKSIVCINDHVLLRWDGAIACKLQRSSSLTKAMWTDVPGSEGQSTIQLPMRSCNEFFRLVTP